MSGVQFAMVGACGAGHDGALWIGTYLEAGGGTTYLVTCTSCGDRPWTAPNQATRSRWFQRSTGRTTK